MKKLLGTKKLSAIISSAVSGLMVFSLLLLPIAWLIWKSISNSQDDAIYFIWSSDLDRLFASFGVVSLQALYSAALIFMFANLAAIGLIALAGKELWATEWAALIPMVLPSIATVVSLKSYGISSSLLLLVISHGLTYSGYFAVQISRQLRSQFGTEIEAALTLGAGRRLIWKAIACSQMRYSLLRAFALAFALCATGLSLPLLLGGVEAYSTELALISALKSDAGWGRALILSVVHLGLLFLIASIDFLSFGTGIPREGRTTEAPVRWGGSIQRIGFFPFAVFCWIPTLAIGIPLIAQVIHSKWVLLDWIPPTALFQAGLGSLAVLMLTAFFSLASLCALCVLPLKRYQSWALGAIAVPSAVLWGMTWTDLSAPLGLSVWADWLRISLVLSVMAVPFLWRSRWAKHRDVLQSVFQHAELLGASRAMALIPVVLPFSRPILMWSLRYLILFALADFAISSLVSVSGTTLGLLAYQLLGSYHLSAAQQLVALILAFSAVIWGITGFVARPTEAHQRPQKEF